MFTGSPSVATHWRGNEKLWTEDKRLTLYQLLVTPIPQTPSSVLIIGAAGQMMTSIAARTRQVCTQRVVLEEAGTFDSLLDVSFRERTFLCNT